MHFFIRKLQNQPATTQPELKTEANITPQPTSHKITQESLKSPQKDLDKHTINITPVISSDEVIKSINTSTITKSQRGKTTGVYFSHKTTPKGHVEITVLKPSSSPLRDLFAYHIANFFHLKCPKTSVIESSKIDNKTISSQASKYTVMMDFITGKSFAEYRDQGTNPFNTTNKQELLRNIGICAIYDLAILNEDRFKLSTSADVNLGNLMIGNDDLHIIDQSFLDHETLWLEAEDLIRQSSVVLQKYSSLEEIALELIKKLNHSFNEQIISASDKETIIQGLKEGINTLKSFQTTYPSFLKKINITNDDHDEDIALRTLFESPLANKIHDYYDKIIEHFS